MGFKIYLNDVLKYDKQQQSFGQSVVAGYDLILK